MRTYKRKNALKECIEPIEGVLGLCRLCLKEAKDSVTIYANKHDVYTTLATRIMMCVGYEITQEDCLPNVICTECHKELNNYYEFRKKCNRTYHKLKTHLLAVQARNETERLSVKQDNRTTDLVKPVCRANQSVGQSVSQLVSALVSQSLAVSKDELILAIDDITQLEFVHFEPEQQNGLDSNLVNVNGITDDNVCCIWWDRTQEPVQSEPAIEVCPNITEFLSSILIEMGVLKKLPHEMQMTEECRTIQIETGDSELITLEILQIDDEERITPTQKIRSIKEKTKNEDTEQKDERPACARCGRRFAARSALRRHARVHTGERPHACAACGLRFSQREVLRRHELVHRDVRPYACAHCPKSFTQRAALAAHARHHASPAAPRELHRCAACPKVFLHASGLSRHARAHSGSVAQCPLCQRRFSDSSSLRRHVRCKHAPSPLAL